MDFTKRTALTPDENREISELLHYAVLTELFDATQWRANQVVFHGGTSLRVARSSDRYSEDLDFLVSPEVTEDLGEAMEKVRDGILVRLALRLPGSNITVKQAKGKEGSLVTGFTIRWEHPMRMGAVRVKAEFYRVPRTLHEAYAAEGILPTRIPDMAVGFKTPIPAPKLIFAWADKVKAIATRDHMKYRDIYDVWFLLRQFKEVPGGDEARDAVSKVASLYDHDLLSVSAGLTNVIDGEAMSDVAAFKEDMAKWLDEDMFRSFDRANFFDTILESVRNELTRANILISEQPCPKM